MVFYQKIGQGEPLIMLHSGGMSHREWEPQIEFLKQYFTLYLIDLPGHGDTLMKEDALTIKECGEAVLSVLDREQVSSAFFCGSSMGGAVALWITMHYSQRVKRLIYYRANYYKNSATFEGTQRMGDPNYWVGLGISSVMSDMHLGQGNKNSWKDVILRVGQALDPKTSDHGYTLEQLKNITQPVLLVCGDRDPLVPLEDVIDMYQTIPDASLWIMPDATHITATNIWRKDIFSHEIQRFLSRNRH